MNILCDKYSYDSFKYAFGLTRFIFFLFDVIVTTKSLGPIVYILFPFEFLSLLLL